MSRSDSSRFPVTVTRLPVTRCEICGRTLAYRPGQASAVLTEHYHRKHPEALVDAADTTRLIRPAGYHGSLRAVGAITLGISVVTLRTPYPVRPAPQATGEPKPHDAADDGDPLATFVLAMVTAASAR